MAHRTNTDTRLLNNLVQTTQAYTKSLQNCIGSSSTATSALQAYASVLTGKDADVINFVGAKMEEVDDAVKLVVGIVEKWRDGLGEVAEAEEEIKRVDRDRNILVSRLIKASKRSSTTTNQPHSHSPFSSPSSSTISTTNINTKLILARSELHACEVELSNKERELQRVRERVVIAGIGERCEALARVGLIVAEVAGSAADVVERWKRGSSNNHRGSNKPSDHSQRQKPLPSPYQHQHRNQQQNGHMITDDNDDDDDGVYERTASTIPNTESSLAHSHDVDDSSEMALVLAHPTPSGSYSGPLVDSALLPHSHSQSNSRGASNNANSNNRNHEIEAPIPPAHAITDVDAVWGYGVSSSPSSADAADAFEAYEGIGRGRRPGRGRGRGRGQFEEYGGYGGRGELRRRITEEDFGDLDLKKDEDGDGDITPLPLGRSNTRGVNGVSSLSSDLVERERRRIQNDDTEEEDGRRRQQNESESDSIDDIPLDGDTNGKRNVTIVENNPFKRGSKNNNNVAVDSHRQDSFPKQYGIGAVPVLRIASGASMGSDKGSGSGMGTGRERKRSFVGALAGLFHPHREREREREREKEEEKERDRAGSGMVLPSSLPPASGTPSGMFGTGRWSMRRGESEDDVGFSFMRGRAKGKDKGWTTRTERNLRSLRGSNGLDGDEDGHARRGNADRSMDIMSDTGVEYTRFDQLQGRGDRIGRSQAGKGTENGRGKGKGENGYGFDKWGVWGNRDDMRLRGGVKSHNQNRGRGQGGTKLKKIDNDNVVGGKGRGLGIINDGSVQKSQNRSQNRDEKRKDDGDLNTISGPGMGGGRSLMSIVESPKDKKINERNKEVQDRKEHNRGRPVIAPPRKSSLNPELGVKVEESRGIEKKKGKPLKSALRSTSPLPLPVISPAIANEDDERMVVMRNGKEAIEEEKKKTGEDPRKKEFSGESSESFDGASKQDEEEEVFDEAASSLVNSDSDTDGDTAEFVDAVEDVEQDVVVLKQQKQQQRPPTPPPHDDIVSAVPSNIKSVDSAGIYGHKDHERGGMETKNCVPERIQSQKQSQKQDENSSKRLSGTIPKSVSSTVTATTIPTAALKNNIDNSPAASATASTSTTTGGTEARRRKSVRMSLQPTFSPTPPADEDVDTDEEGGSGRRYAPWSSVPTPATGRDSTMSKSNSRIKHESRDLTNFNLNGQVERERRSSWVVGGRDGGGSAAGENNHNVWADSSEEDEEYSRARKLLWGADKKVEKAAVGRGRGRGRGRR